MRNRMTEVHDKHRVVTFLNRQEVDFLDNLGKDAMFSTGIKLSRTRIIEDLVELLSKTQIVCQGIKTDEELERIILTGMRDLYEKFRPRENPSPKENLKSA